MDKLLIGDGTLVIEQLRGVALGQAFISLSEKARAAVQQSYAYLQEVLLQNGPPIYGVNTGFGALCDTRIATEELLALQRNLLMSHACGTGPEVPPEVVRLMLVLKAQSLAFGYSGVQPSTVQRLLDFYTADILPVVYTQGSLGASGDLAPLAHLSLPLIGMGLVVHNGQRMPAEVALANRDMQPLQLAAKEGLALLNGTQFMTAYLVHCLLRLQCLLAWSDVIAALSLDAFLCLTDPFHPLLQALKQHPGQQHTANLIRQLRQGSPLASQPKTQVQDPYSFRCIPQVHGAVKDLLAFATNTVQAELQSVSDNPNVFAAENLILSGGNFHGQPLAIAADVLCLGIAQLGGISERRTFQLLSGTRGLPAFLATQPGLHSGLMITQYTAAAIVNENKQLAQPNSHDSLTSSNGQEDYVSMGANAAVKCSRAVDNLATILAIELLNASQALSFRDAPTSPALAKVLAEVREIAPPASTDRRFGNDIQQLRQWLLQQPLPEGISA